MSSEGTYFGLTRQAEKGTPIVTDNLFDYMLLLRSGIGEQNVNLPLDMEIGGGAMLRNVVKTGLTTGGPIRFIPRPHTLGHFLAGYFGHQLAPVQGTLTDLGSYSHMFKFGASQFVSPYFTLRSAPGGMYGMQYQDSVLQAFSLEFRAADFVRSTAAWLGGLPTKVSTALWDPSAAVDGGPQFLSVVSGVIIPDGEGESAITNWKVLEGAVVFESAIPLDEQWVVGSYVPDDYPINQRAVSISMRVKVSDDGALYRKMSYDPADGATWVADLLRKSDVSIKLASPAPANGTEGRPNSVEIKANGDASNPNVVFTVAPLDIVPGRQIIMDVTGTFLADPTGLFDPLTVELINGTATAYAPTA